MAKDKIKEAEYKAEGLRRMKLRKELRLAKFVTRSEDRRTFDEYSCPQCGLNSMYCFCVDYGYDCPKCKIHFETPDT